jgi:hypothetical protein
LFGNLFDIKGIVGLGKVVIDSTNPIADQAPTNGVISFFTGPNDSLLERLQPRAILDAFGWETEDVGAVEAAEVAARRSRAGRSQSIVICLVNVGAALSIGSIGLQARRRHVSVASVWGVRGKEALR